MGENNICEKEVSRDGLNIYKIINKERSIYLGSKYNEKNNINKFINNLNIGDGEELIVIIGLSGGEYLKSLLEVIEEGNRLIIIEPEEAIYRENNRNNNINKYLKDSRVSYILFEDKINFEKSLDIIIDKSYKPIIKFSIYTNYDKIYSTECNHITSSLSEYLEYIKLLRNTNLALRDSTIENYINNFYTLGSAISAYRFKGKFLGKTAIIVSSGPSLSKNIEVLKSYKDKVLIIAVARSLKELLHHGIEPNFICALDPGNIMFELMKENLHKEIPMITLEQANGRLLSEYKGKKVFVLNAFKNTMSKLFNEEFISLPNGGSVAHLATSFALFLGVKNVIFIGQDLAFTNMEYHSKLSTNEELVKSKASFNKNSLVYVEGNDEDLVPTNNIFLAFKNWFERFIDANEEVNFINSTKGGARIQGTSIMELENALGTYTDESINFKKEINEVVSQVSNLKLTNNQDEIIHKYLEGLLYKALEGVQLSNDMINYYNNSKGDIRNINRKLDKVDKYLYKNQEIMNFINFVAYEDLEKITLSIEYRAKLRENPFEKSIRICKRNIAIYEAYVKAIRDILDFNKNCKEKIFCE